LDGSRAILRIEAETAGGESHPAPRSLDDYYITGLFKVKTRIQADSQIGRTNSQIDQADSRIGPVDLKSRGTYGSMMATKNRAEMEHGF